MRPAVSDIAFNEAGQLVVKTRPCETPTGVANYTKLLRPDQIVMGRGYYAEGSGVTATRPFVTYVPPAQATIVYTSAEVCQE